VAVVPFNHRDADPRYLCHREQVEPVVYEVTDDTAAQRVRGGSIGQFACVGSGFERPLPGVLVPCLSVAGKSATYSPSFTAIEGLVGQGKHLAGWRLDYFVADLVMGYKQGKLLDEANVDGMTSLFFNRSGPISAAIAIGIDKCD
jgi:hypothetical protein